MSDQTPDNTPDNIPEGPEFWFDKDGKIWFAHNCDGVYREYTLVPAVYRIVQREPVTILPPVCCGICKLRGTILDGVFVQAERPPTSK